VPAIDKLKLASRRIEQSQAERGYDVRVIPLQRVVEQTGNCRWRMPFTSERSQRVPELSHDGCKYVEAPLSVSACFGQWRRSGYD